MNVIYLPSTLDDIEWFHRYYTYIFPEGANNATKQFQAVKELLSSNPKAGSFIHKNVREFSIPRTPFSYIYRVKGDEVQVLRIWDERRNPDDLVY
jgi:plasmid stabilization system protein ParE